MAPKICPICYTEFEPFFADDDICVQCEIDLLRESIDALPPVDEGSDCRMCGKPVVYNSTDGMCGTCRQIWNG